MRLFIAVNFNENINQNIVKIQNNLKSYATGSFTLPKNIHLTLVFLGNTNESQLDNIKQALMNTPIPKTTLTFSKIGHFTKGNNKIYWLGIDENPALSSLQNSLAQSMRNLGFDIENRSYTPHVTLARRVKVHKKIDSQKIINHPFTTDINSISLMHSHQVNGVLTYTEIFKVSSKD